jgi:hypothetical protein
VIEYSFTVFSVAGNASSGSLVLQWVTIHEHWYICTKKSLECFPKRGPIGMVDCISTPKRPPRLAPARSAQSPAAEGQQQGGLI